MQTLVAEDLLLLLLDDAKGTLVRTSYVDVALGGALLTELALAGAVTVPERTSVWRSARVRAADGARVDDPILAEGLAVVAAKERTAQELVKRLGKGLRTRLATSLVERGILVPRADRVLGLIPVTRFPTADPAHEQEVRRGLTAALVQGAEPDERTAALIALLAAIGRAHRTVEHEGLSSREVRRRAGEIARGDWAAEAVRDAIRSAIAATAAAASTAGAAGAAAGD